MAWRTAAATSLGALLCWYDFYVYFLLVSFVASRFFPSGEGAFSLIAVFATYGAGVLIRPVGALMFGRIGDLLGRRHAFLLSLVAMGAATVVIGILPTYGAIGFLAPLLLMTTRLVQGLAFGGLYGAAVTIAAESMPDRRRGLFTSSIQVSATLGLFVALLVLGLCRTALDPQTFAAWGWRIPFLGSIVPLLLAIPLWGALPESPVFERLDAEGKRSTAPVGDTLLDGLNVRYLLLALLGAAAGHGVIWYTSQLYALFFLTAVLKVDDVVAYGLVGVALLIGLPFFAFFGWLSDRIGRLKIIMAGCLIAALTYFPLFQALTHYANPALEQYRQKVPISVAAAGCGVHVFATLASVLPDCERVKRHLAGAGLSFASAPAVPDQPVVTMIGSVEIKGWKPDAIADALKATGYPAVADPERINYPVVLGLLTVMVMYVAMVSGPLGAFLAELFPARIRQTSVSLPFQLGHGGFGGMVPLAAAALAASSGSIYQGLWYPIVVALLSIVVGTLFLTETKNRSIQMLERTEVRAKL